MSDDVQRRAGAFRRRVALVPLLIGPALVAGDSASGNQSLSFGWPDAPISSYGDRLRALPDLNGDGSADFAVNSGQCGGVSLNGPINKVTGIFSALCTVDIGGAIAYMSQ
ncbi:MAG: hypothetical protein AAGA55_06875, partial [Planctomycetota bacterium]